MTVHLKKIVRHYFIPHESNNYKARSLHPTSLIFYIILLFVFQMIISFAKRIEPNILGYATDITVEKILFLVNQERAKANLNPLIVSPELSNAATQKATDMFGNNYWAHVSPTGVTPWQFITSSGYNYLYAGENLAKDFVTSEEVVQAWMKSSTHKANILKPEYTNIGLAIMNGRLQGNETTLVIQEFGSKVDNTLAAKSTIPVVRSETVSELPPVEVAGQKSSLSPIKISKTFSLFIAEFLLVVLLIDGIYMWRAQTMRLSSHTLAHIIFLFSLIGAMGATGIGVIL